MNELQNLHIVEHFAWLIYRNCLLYGYTEGAAKVKADAERKRWMQPHLRCKL